MRKCILFLASFCFLFLFSIGANAYVTPDWTYTMTRAGPITDGVEFNIMVGCPDNSFTNTPYYNLIDSLSTQCNIQKGGFSWTGKIYATNNSLISADVYAEFKAENTYVYSSLLKLDNNIIYSMTTTLCDDPHATINKEIDLNEYFNTTGLTFSYYCGQRLTVLDDSDMDFSVIPQYEPYDLGMGFMIGTVYKKNTAYDGKDLYYVTSVDNPITIDEILASVVIEDATEGDISSKARIEDNNYILVDGKIAVGSYSFKIVASDDAGNTTVQQAYVRVADITPPEITASDVEVEYCKQISDVKTLFTVSDNTSSCSLEIIEDNYTDNASKLGTYTVTARASDNDSNTATKTINIKVIDLIAPYLVFSVCKATTTNPISSIDALKNYVTCEDYIDGTNTIIEIADTDNYFSNQAKIGSFNFAVTGYDQSGNSCSGVLTLSISDTDYPDIYADEYTITINQGEELTRDDIVNLLIQLGQVSSASNVTLTSAYFDTPDVAGDYELIISTPDGVYKDVISVKEKANSTDSQTNRGETIIDYSIPTTENKKDYTYYYVIAAVVGVLLISSLGIYIYKRKH